MLDQVQARFLTKARPHFLKLANLDLANILGDTDLDFMKLCFFEFLRFLQIPNFPDCTGHGPGPVAGPGSCVDPGPLLDLALKPICSTP